MIAMHVRNNDAARAQARAAATAACYFKDLVTLCLLRIIVAGLNISFGHLILCHSHLLNIWKYLECMKIPYKHCKKLEKSKIYHSHCRSIYTIINI